MTGEILQFLTAVTYKPNKPNYGGALGEWLGGYPAFIITSILAAMFDMMFVIMQRYNRQRILKLIK